MSAHKHAWKLTLHLDGCHFYSSAYACECGATLSVFDERSPKDDPYSTVWMSREDGEEECERCTELLAGAKPKHTQAVTEKSAA